MCCLLLVAQYQRLDSPKLGVLTPLPTPPLSPWVMAVLEEYRQCQHHHHHRRRCPRYDHGLGSSPPSASNVRGVAPAGVLSHVIRNNINLFSFSQSYNHRGELFITIGVCLFFGYHADAYAFLFQLSIRLTCEYCIIAMTRTDLVCELFSNKFCPFPCQ